MISRDDLYFCLLHLVPDAKFSFWPDDGVRDQVEMGNEMPLVKMDGWVIDWKKENGAPCPSLDDIKKLDMSVIYKANDDKLKQIRNKEKAADLTLVAMYQAALVSNPKLAFSDYVDGLEVQSKALIAQIG